MDTDFPDWRTKHPFDGEERNILAKVQGKNERVCAVEVGSGFRVIWEGPNSIADHGRVVTNSKNTTFPALATCAQEHQMSVKVQFNHDLLEEE
ncbi:hypothetical protein [Haloferax sp. Atlit-4N]|uniref:hypothetical protein n=1 Tax=Haloferax sp. Atlit-4N TaxID=2077206 RepID=UPI0011C06A3C|nr:hypothetical protein [Haloferax sp. Atlit-4N]